MSWTGRIEIPFTEREEPGRRVNFREIKNFVSVEVPTQYPRTDVK